MLDDVSFSVKKGQAVVVLGPSGCGKSTLCVVLSDLKTFRESYPCGSKDSGGTLTLFRYRNGVSGYDLSPI